MFHALRALLFFYFFCLSTTALNKYTFLDLEILSKQKEFSEFFTHAKDLPPTKRDKKWEDLVGKTARNWLSLLIQQEEIEVKSQKQIFSIASWHVLKKDEFFKLKFDEFLIRLLSQSCSEKKNHQCLKDSLKFWEKSFKSLELASAIINTSSSEKPFESLREIYQYLLEKDKKALFCEKETFVDYFQSTLQTFIQEDHIKAEISKNISTKCWSFLKQNLLTKIERSSTIKDEPLYLLLDSLGAVHQGTRDKWLTLYFLQNGANKELINKAWTLLSSLRENFERRTLVLSEFKKWDFLPGKVFEEQNKEKRQALIHHLSTNFPEYLNLYVDRCLSYFSGSKSFPKGNPTKECKELRKVLKHQNWVSQARKKALEKI